MRKFFSSLLNFMADRKPTTAGDGFDLKYQDAMQLADRLLHNKHVSRRIMERRGMSQRRYDAACALLKACHLLVVLSGHAPVLAWGVDDIEEVDRVLSEWVDEQRRRGKEHRRYVPPLPP